MQYKADTIINPIRLRIIQYAAQNDPITVAQIAQAMSDVSKPTIYRHVRILTESGILSIVGEEKIRGTFEQSYALNLNQINATGEENQSELQALVLSVLTKLIADFAQYFGDGSADPIADKLFAGTNTLFLGDAEFDEFIKEIYEVVEKYALFPVRESAKARMITWISSPATQEITEE